MSSHTIRFIKYLLGLRSPITFYSNAELKFLGSLAVGKKCIIKVGVVEGVDSKVFCQSMECNGKLYLVDPFLPQVKLEKLLNISFNEFVAKQCVKDYSGLVQFAKLTFVEAAKYLKLEGKADLIFIDGRHDYESVLDDFKCWSRMLYNGGIIAFPFSRICKERPDLNPQAGAIRLCNEISKGEHGNWNLVDEFEWITVISANSNRQILIQ